MIINFKLIIFIFNFKIIISKFVNIQTDIFVCEKINKEDTLLDFSCEIKTSSLNDEKFISQTNFKGEIWREEAYKVRGYIILCNRKMHTLSTWRNFFGDKFKEIKIENALIGPNECKDMILTKKCGNQNMQCDKNGCFFSPTLQGEFWWLSTSVVSSLECRYEKKKILQNDEKIYGCHLNRLECITETNTYIWDKELFDHCPFRYVTSKVFNQVQNNVIKVNNGRQIFSIVDILKIEKCPFESIFKTNEGLFIVNSSTDHLVANNSILFEDNTQYTDLLLAEIDGNQYETVEIQTQSLKENCIIVRDILNRIKYQKNAYEKILASQKEIIVYINDGLIFIPKCFLIHEIQIETDGPKADTCFKDPKITFNVTMKLRSTTKVKIKKNQFSKQTGYTSNISISDDGEQYGIIKETLPPQYSQRQQAPTNTRHNQG